MKNSTKLFLVLVGLALIGLGFINWYYLKQKNVEPAAETVFAPPTAPASQVDKNKPAAHYPITPAGTDQAPADALPSLAVSDTAMRNALANLINEKAFLQYFYPNEIIRRLVVSIDNLPRENVSAQLLPLKPVTGQFLVKEADNTINLDAANYQRYTPYVELIQNLDTKKLVAVYKYFYPLFQQQYQELGYPEGYFNDRLIVVMDYMLNLTQADGPLPLVQKHVLYQYADPEKESMSAGAKLFTRMGHENALKVKDKLREIRTELIKQK